MNSQINFKEVKNRFHFDYVEHDPDLEKTANLKLVQLLAFAPPSATGVGWVEKTESGFLSTVRILSPFRTFTAKAMGTSAASAIMKALERLEDELYRWRFGGGGTGNYGSFGRQESMPTTPNLPAARSA